MSSTVHTVLQSPALWFAARLLLAVVFVSSGLAKLIAFEGGVAEMRAAGLEPARLYNIGVAFVLLAGAACILLDRHLWIAAGVLSVFLLLTIPIVHRFWDLPEPRAQLALFFALEHLSVVGGLLAAAIASSLRAAVVAPQP